jgi:hypothetical protein
MKPSTNALWKFLGLNTQGDLGPVTFYTSKDQGLVFYLSTSPKKPQSHRQRHQRNMFRAAATVWNRFSRTERKHWERAAKRARLRITGFNAFVHILLKNDLDWYSTLCHAAGTSPPLFPGAE